MAEPRQPRTSLLRPVLGIGAGLAIAAVIMRASGFHPIEAYCALWSGATGLAGGPALGSNSISFGNGHLNLFLLAQSLARVTPLVFTGLAVAVGLRAGLFNIGAQGQMTVGALCAAIAGECGKQGSEGAGAWNRILHVIFVLLAAAAGGALWGALPGIWKATRGVHEVISTIMLNFVALDIVQYLVTHGLHDPSPNNMAAESALMANTSWLWPYIRGSNFTAGLPIAVGCTAIVTFLIRRTSAGYKIRAVGLGAEAARANGINVGRVIVLTMALSGGIAGLAGAIEVMGIHHRYVGGVAGSFGFDGIAVALLGNLTGEGVILAALFFGALASGSGYMETTTNVPAPISEIVQATVILFVGMRFVGRNGASTVTAASEPQSTDISEGAAEESVEHP